MIAFKSVFFRLRLRYSYRTGQVLGYPLHKFTLPAEHCRTVDLQRLPLGISEQWRSQHMHTMPSGQNTGMEAAGDL
jgi:hypothetical protein